MFLILKIRNPEGAFDYTFLQAAERMKKIRKLVYPPTPRNLLQLSELLKQDKTSHFTTTFQTPTSL